MAAASVAQNWRTEQSQSSPRISTSRVSFQHSYYNRPDYNTGHYGFSRNGNISILDKSQNDRYCITRPLRVDPRSASIVNMNHIYMHHRPYASVISPGYLRQELQRSIHSKEYPLMSSFRSIHQARRHSSGKYPLDKHLGIVPSSKSHRNSSSNIPSSSIYNIDSHTSNTIFQTEDSQIFHNSNKANNTHTLLKSFTDTEFNVPISSINDDKNISALLFNEDMEPDIINDVSKVKTLKVKTFSEHNGDMCIQETKSPEHNVINDNFPSQTKSLKAKILKVLSFSSLPSLETINTNNVYHMKNYNSSQNTSNNSPQLNNIDINSDIYFSKKTSSDNVSISSTASSASIMLRKISKEGKGMLKRSKRALSSILKGSLHIENSKVTMSKEYKKNTMKDINKINVEIENTDNSLQIGTEDIENAENHYKEDLLETKIDDIQNQNKNIYIEKDDTVSQFSNDNISINTTSINHPKENKNDHSTYFKPFPAIKKGILKYTDWSPAAPNFKSSHSLTDLTIQFTPPTPLELVTFNDVPTAIPSSETSIPKNTKSLSFSPKITIYDTWPSFEYDRRGEIATCNRLTPILAQRIKEELNTYKLDEMIVHEQTVGKNKRLSKGKKGIKKKVVDPFLRKDWYDLKAPSIFETRNFGKTLVNRSTGMKNANDSLRGRVVEVSLADLQKDEEYAFRKIKLQIADVQGKNCLTNFYGMSMTSDKLRSLVRRWQTLIEAHQDVKTTDGYVLRLFVIGFTKRRTNQIKKTAYAQTSQIRQIRKKMFEIMQREASSCSMKDLVQKFIPEVIGREITKSTQGIFPLQNVFIHKVKILKMPRIDIQRLLELHEDSVEDTGSKVSKDFKKFEILDSV
ncbi:hypothetical protein PORY_000280 [Pneumocystis oryctolagi]|uniref:Uncharacterized protein n=1 Tax=Pneumocystis oryctolagi TaxID=42067 RepID=A0ACB7CGI3_9ASCO|nr:hypothetical protein PORY_000280 [Pneumocystis oryctolagi]